MSLDLKEDLEEIRELGLTTGIELTSDKVNRSYLLNLTLIYYINSIFKGDSSGAANLVETIEDLMSDFWTLDSEYCKFRLSLEEDWNKLLSNLSSGSYDKFGNPVTEAKPLSPAEKDNLRNKFRLGYARTKFSALIKLMNRSSLYGTRRGGAYATIRTKLVTGGEDTEDGVEEEQE